MLDVAETAGPGERLHTLLLAMTGRVDDDAVNSTRELLGAAQADTAAHFLTGCLLAGRIRVSATEQHQLRRTLSDLHLDAELAERLSVVDQPEEPAAHRFDASSEPEHALTGALAPVAHRLTGLRGLWTTWRTTPAGDNSGALPRRVLLAEVGADGSPAALGYQLLEALRQAGLDCSVDVFASGAELPEYHRGALAAAHRVHLETPVETGVPAVGTEAVTMPAAVPEATPRERMPRSTSRESDAEGAPHRVEVASEPQHAAPDPDVSAAAGGSVPEPVFPRISPEEFPAAEAEPESPRAEAAPAPAALAEHPAAGADAAAVDIAAVQEPAPAETPAAAAAPAEVPADLPAETPVDTSPDASAETPAEVSADPAAQQESADPDDDASVGVPAAVDAKLTDRERNLLRKLHEELAQREQDRTGEEGGAPVAAGGAQPGRAEGWSQGSAGGTGGFPPINPR
ncbi:hypothetical protein [Salinifilum ghardaiensis]